MKEERILEFRKTKKASFDGKSYLIRLPTKIVHFLKENQILIEKMTIEGVWKRNTSSFCILITFNEKQRENIKDHRTKEHNDYVILRG